MSDMKITQLFKIKPPVVYKPIGDPVHCTNPQLILGVELETENANPDENFYHGGPAGFIVDRDGSLRGGNTAYEFKSKPMFMENLIPELWRFFEYTNFNNDNYSDRCSVHVHANVTNFTQEQLSVLCAVYSVVEEVLFEFVNHFNVADPEGAHRDINIYCIPWNQCRMNLGLLTKMFNNPGEHIRRWQKYTALNILPILTQGSVEWRHMHGTADMEKLTLWLNLIGAIMGYATRVSLDEVHAKIRSLNDSSAYQHFFDEVLGGTLPYNDKYQQAMYDGVISAKMMLWNWDHKKEVVHNAAALEDALARLRQEVVIEDWALRPGILQAEPQQVQRVQPRRPAPARR